MTFEATNPEVEEDISDAAGVDQEEDQIDVEDQGDDGSEDAEEESDEDASQDDDTEEVEVSGQKYRIPKALKANLMLQADYTRKTQEVADMRRDYESKVAAYEQDAEELTDARLNVRSIKGQLDQIKALTPQQWSQIEQQDYANGTNHAQQYLRQMTYLQTQLADAEGKVTATEKKVLDQQQATLAQQFQQGREVLARDIKGWGPELVGKLTSFAHSEFGISAEELGSVSDPRVIKVLHRAMQNTQANKQNMAHVRAAKANAIKPVPKVSGNGNPKAGMTDSLSTEEWVRRREQQLANRKS